MTDKRCPVCRGRGATRFYNDRPEPCSASDDGAVLCRRCHGYGWIHIKEAERVQREPDWFHLGEAETEP